MSNETDLDWLARNVHVWPAGEHQPWCYVYMAYGGVIKASGNFLDAVAKPTMITMFQWLARRAELQNKPTEWPKRANWLAQHEDGEWTFYSDSADNPPQHRPDGNWYSDDVAVKCRHSGEVLGDWRDTLERRPESTRAEMEVELVKAAFKPFTSIEDNQEQDMTQQQEMKQDNGWFERGELPPVGTRCVSLLGIAPKANCEVIAKTEQQMVVKWEENGMMDVIDLDVHVAFRPIPTERDVLIEIIKKTDDTDDKIADAILAAGFSLGAK